LVLLHRGFQDVIPLGHADHPVGEQQHGALELCNLSRPLRRSCRVDDVSLSIESGEFVTLLGPSGCGKTTLLRMIAGFELPDSGRILLDGATSSTRRPKSVR